MRTESVELDLFSAGNLDLKMPPLDPLVVTTISVQYGARQPVTISLQLNDVETHGICSGHLKAVRLFSSPSDCLSLLRKLLLL
jgi:hypothetical protein